MCTRMTQRSLISMSLAVLATAAALGQCLNQRPNGYCPESTPRLGEVAIWQQQFKATHNSFQLSEDLDVQIDDYNNWLLELDLQYNEGEIIVEHHCFDTAGNQTFAEALLEIARSSTAAEKVTFIYLNRVTSGDFFYCYDTWPGSYRTLIQDALFAAIDEDRFYRKDDFTDIDNAVWPSVQELVRRGQNFVVSIDGGGNDFFFSTSDVVPREGGCDGGGSPEAWTADPGSLSRVYPSSICSTNCDFQDGGYFEDGVVQGYTFIANNCVDNEDCIDPRIHSPSPFYVAASGAPDHQWGTHSFPRVGPVGLLMATALVSPMVDVKIRPGDYSVSFLTGGSFTVSRPMVLKKNGGGVDVSIR